MKKIVALHAPAMAVLGLAAGASAQEVIVSMPIPPTRP